MLILVASVFANIEPADIKLRNMNNKLSDFLEFTLR